MRADDDGFISLRVVLSHMVVKQVPVDTLVRVRLRVVLSHMVVKPVLSNVFFALCLRVVLSHMVVKLALISWAGSHV